MVRLVQRPFFITTSGLLDFGIPRQQKWKGLKALREEGLVGIESRPGKNPKVTLIDPPLEKKRSGEE